MKSTGRPQYSKGQHENAYVLALQLGSCEFADVTDFSTVSSRIFNVYRWKTDIVCPIDNTKKEILCSGYCPWLHFIPFDTKKRWVKYADVTKISEKFLTNRSMMFAHLFFKSLDEFRNWLGEDEFRTLLAHLF